MPKGALELVTRLTGGRNSQTGLVPGATDHRNSEGGGIQMQPLNNNNLHYHHRNQSEYDRAGSKSGSICEV